MAGCQSHFYVTLLSNGSQNCILQIRSVRLLPAWGSLYTCVRRIEGKLEYVNLYVTRLIRHVRFSTGYLFEQCPHLLRFDNATVHGRSVCTVFKTFHKPIDILYSHP